MRKVLLALVAVVIVAVGWYFIYTHPKHVKRTFYGVEYHVGVPRATVKPVTVQVNGALQRSIRGIGFVVDVLVIGLTGANEQ